MRWSRDFSATYADTDFALDAKYTYEEVCRLLGWETNVNAQNIGGYRYDKVYQHLSRWSSYQP